MGDRFCMYCGSRLPEKARFCPNCGSPVEMEDAGAGGPSAGSAPKGVSGNRSVAKPAPMCAPAANSAPKRRGGVFRAIGSLFSGKTNSTRKQAQKTHKKMEHASSSKTVTSKALSSGSGAKETTPVEFTAVAAKRFEVGVYSPLKIYMYEEAYRYIVDNEKEEMEDGALESRGGVSEIPIGASVCVRLSCREDVIIEECSQTMVWNGKYLIFPFAVKLPAEFCEAAVCFTAKVLVNDVPKITMKIAPKVSTDFLQKIEMERNNIASAFMSYASQDRADVAMIVAAIEKVCPDMDIFFDVESIHSGEKWESILYKEIQNRDVLFLCWSRNAKQSEWVEKEWRYALQKRGYDFIEPIPLELPTECPPPEELKGKHFNDQRLYIRAMCKKK